MVKDNKNCLNVIFSSDDNYAQHLGVAIYSLLKHNQVFAQIQIFIIDNEISEENKERLLNITYKFSNVQIHWILFEKWKSELKLNMPWNISISSYGRIFIGSMLPKEIERVLYLDCDMIVCEELESLWSMDLRGSVLGAVQDTISDSIKAAVGKTALQPYFNAGMLMIDLNEWRTSNTEELCMKFLNEHKGSVVHHDQGILNGVLQNSWYRLPLEYNLMTIHYIFTQKKIQKYFCDHSKFYSQMEVMSALKAPKILHFTPSFTSRPWTKGCKHPLKKIYWDMLKETSWKNAKPQKDKCKWYVQIINWRYRKLPF